MAGKLEKAEVSQNYLREKRSLLSLFLQTICHKSLHGLWAITAHFAQVRGKVTSANHKDNLHRRDMLITFSNIQIFALILQSTDLIHVIDPTTNTLHIQYINIRN